jgi:di/tricarboxylate transporter
MVWEAVFALGVIAVMTFALLRGLARPDTALLGGLAVFMTMGLFSERFPTPAVLVAGFGNEGLAAIAVLFVVATGLSQTGAMGLVTQPLLGRPRTLLGAQTRLMAPVATLSAFVSNTPIVAMFTPVVADWCRKSRLQPGKLFIPLSYAAVLGGTCSLIGTSTNIYIYGWLNEALKQRMGMFTIGLVGVPAAVAGIAYVLIVSRRLLPAGATPEQHAGDAREYTVEMLVETGSSIDGTSIEKAGLRRLPGSYLMEIERSGERITAVPPEQILHGGDRLIFVGIIDSVRDLQKIRGLVPATDQVFKVSDSRTDRVLIEAVVSDQSPLVGKTVREGRFRTVYNAVIIAVRRGGERIRRKIGDIVLRPGDTLLIEAHPRFVERHRNSLDFYLTSAVADSQPLRHDRAYLAIAILVGMIAAVSSGLLGLLNASLVAATLMILFGCCSTVEARRNINWRILLAMGAAMGIGATLASTGAAEVIAEGVLVATRGLGPRGVLAGLYLIALLFNMMIGHAGAAALAYPIAQAVAVQQGIDPMALVIGIMMAASADFANPISYPTHLMVYGAGGYQFSDFVRVGLPLNLIVMTVTVLLAPLFWPL